MNSYFIESIDIIGSHLCDIFNTILNSGFYQYSWTESTIIPLFKKGKRDNVANYRGISLISCLAKIFTGILNNRISKWCEENYIISMHILALGLGDLQSMQLLFFIASYKKRYWVIKDCIVHLLT
jgi:hypothetical protein